VEIVGDVNRIIVPDEALLKRRQEEREGEREQNEAESANLIAAASEKAGK
jgi:hypothetical protein